MSKTWKWILGILLVLVLVGAFFVVGYGWRMHAVGMMPYRSMQFDRDWNGPTLRQWNHPMMGGRGLMPFGGFFLFGGLVKWVLFFGLLYFAYWLGRRNARLAIDPAPAARVDASASPEAGSAPASQSEKKTE